MHEPKWIRVDFPASDAEELVSWAKILSGNPNNTTSATTKNCGVRNRQMTFFKTFGVLMFTPKTLQEANLESYSLGPKEKIEFVWDQIKNDGDVALEGLYKIHSKGFDPKDKKVEKFTTITIWK